MTRIRKADALLMQAMLRQVAGAKRPVNGYATGRAPSSADVLANALANEADRIFQEVRSQQQEDHVVGMMEKGLPVDNESILSALNEAGLGEGIGRGVLADHLLGYLRATATLLRR